jgi:signal transduction histidine kinase
MTRQRPPFASLLLTVLAVVAAAEMAVGALVYRHLALQLETDLAQRLVNVAQLVTTGVDASLGRQFREGDERLPAYDLVRARLASQGRAAGVLRVYVFDAQLRTLVDGEAAKPPGRPRNALLANRAEVAAAAAGQAKATRLYRDDGGQLRLSAFAAVARSGTPATVLVGVDASPVFFDSLAALRRQMLLLGACSLALVGGAGFVVMRQVGARLQSLRRAVTRAASGDLAASSGVAGADEIGALGQDLDGMIAAMVAARDEYAAVLASLDVGVVTCDDRGVITLANLSARRLLAVPGEIVGCAVEVVLAHEDALRDFALAALGAPQPASAELPLRGGLAAGGSVVAVGASPLRGTGVHPGFVLSLLDVTLLRDIERRARTNERLAALGGMAGGLLHEIRTPLASMTVYLDLLRAPLQDTGEPRELLSAALLESERLARFLEDFQVYAGLRPLRRERVELRAVVEASIHALRPPANVRVRAEIAEGLTLSVDRSLLEHGLRNLLQNAVDALGARPGTIDVSGAGEDGHVRLRIADNGPGIAPEALARILDPMFTTKPAGIGLGLSIVQRVVERHGGTISVYSPPGGGATFVLRLPTEGP